MDESALEAAGNGSFGDQRVTIEGSLGPIDNFSSGDNLRAEVIADIGNAHVEASVLNTDGVLAVDFSTSALGQP